MTLKELDQQTTCVSHLVSRLDIPPIIIKRYREWYWSNSGPTSSIEPEFSQFCKAHLLKLLRKRSIVEQLLMGIDYET